MQVIFGILLIAILLYIAFWMLVILVACLGIGLVVGIVPAIYTSIKSYLGAIRDEITNPIIAWTLRICMIPAVAAIAAPVVMLIIGIVQSFL